MTLSIIPPFPVFTGRDGQPVDDGRIYVGVANLDPIANPVALFWDAALSIPAAQPVMTSGGYAMFVGSPARLYAGATSVSIRVLDAAGGLVFNAASLDITGTVTSVDASGGATGFSFSGGPITGAGTLTLAVDDAAMARAAIVAAVSGANDDITSLRQDVAIAESGTYSANTLGFRGMPVVTLASGGTLDITHASKTIYTAGNITIPSNAAVAFPIGTMIEISNSTNATVTIAITTDTMRQSGTTNTGTRTLAVYGDCVIKKRTATLWYIIGNVS